MANQNDLRLIGEIIGRLDQNRISRFAYKDDAFISDNIDGVEVFDIDANNNIPTADCTLYNEKVLDTGLRAQGASITRDGWNHFIGRTSFNVNKLIQKILQFFNLTAEAWAHNAFEYDPAARYATGDICYFVETLHSVRIYTYYQRTSRSPTRISNIPPTVALHWAPMQEKTSAHSLLPFTAPGYRHTYSIVDFTEFSSALWYPVVTATGDLENAMQTLIEVFCHTEEYLAEFAIVSKFTGFADSSTDIVINNSFTNFEDGILSGTVNSPIGFSKLPESRQAILWLKGGAKYALWNSYGSLFSLAEVLEPVDYRIFEINCGTIQARLKTPNAVNIDEAPNLGQLAGSLPQPKNIQSGSQIVSIRTPGLYVVDNPTVARSITGLPVQNPGPFTLIVEGDKNGMSVTTQRFMQRNTGKEYIQTLSGTRVIEPWYLASSPNGMSILVRGLYAFHINSAGHLILSYQDGADIPDFHIDERGHLIASIS